MTLRESYWGPQHGYTSAAGCDTLPTCTFIHQAPVLLTDLEGRYNITDQLQLAIGANNLFNMHPEHGAVESERLLHRRGLRCSGQWRQRARHAQLQQFDPNGGYYYGRISFNF